MFLTIYKKDAIHTEVKYEMMKLITQTHQVKQHYFASSEENVSTESRPIDLQLV
jgi:hypothetical protein